MTSHDPRQFLADRLAQHRLRAAMETLEDPEARIRKGQRIRWKHDRRGDGHGDMEVLFLCAPSGLYRRPLRDGDEPWRMECAALMNAGMTSCNRDAGVGMTPCDKEDEGAVYHPEGLMVFFRYLYNSACTTGNAINMIVVADHVSEEESERIASTPLPPLG